MNTDDQDQPNQDLKEGVGGGGEEYTFRGGYSKLFCLS